MNKPLSILVKADVLHGSDIEIDLLGYPRVLAPDILDCLFALLDGHGRLRAVLELTLILTGLLGTSVTVSSLIAVPGLLVLSAFAVLALALLFILSAARTVVITAVLGAVIALLSVVPVVIASAVLGLLCARYILSHAILQ